MFSAYPFLMWRLRKKCVIHLVIIMKSDVRIISHCLWLVHETIVCAVCLDMLLCVVFFFERWNDRRYTHTIFLRIIHHIKGKLSKHHPDKKYSEHAATDNCFIVVCNKYHLVSNHIDTTITKSSQIAIENAVNTKRFIKKYLHVPKQRNYFLE